MDKIKYTNTRNKFENAESTFPQYIKARTPPMNRHTLDPNQLRKTMESFHVLSSANENTAKHLFTEVKEAAEYYADVKREYFQHATNPLFKNNTLNDISLHQQETIKTDSTQGPPKEDTNNQPLRETKDTEENMTTADNITFNLGSSDLPPPPLRKNSYKPPTPPQESPCIEESESPKEGSPPPRRLLRSNSTTQNRH